MMSLLLINLPHNEFTDDECIAMDLPDMWIYVLGFSAKVF